MWTFPWVYSRTFQSVLMLHPCWGAVYANTFSTVVWRITNAISVSVKTEPWAPMARRMLGLPWKHSMNDSNQWHHKCLTASVRQFARKPVMTWLWASVLPINSSDHIMESLEVGKRESSVESQYGRATEGSTRRRAISKLKIIFPSLQFFQSWN